MVECIDESSATLGISILIHNVLFSSNKYVYLVKTQGLFWFGVDRIEVCSLNVQFDKLYNHTWQPSETFSFSVGQSSSCGSSSTLFCFGVTTIRHTKDNNNNLLNPVNVLFSAWCIHTQGQWDPLSHSAYCICFGDTNSDLVHFPTAELHSSCISITVFTQNKSNISSAAVICRCFQ